MKHSVSPTNSHFPLPFSGLAISGEPHLHSFPAGFSLTELLVPPRHDQHAAASVLWFPPVASDLPVEFFLQAQSMYVSNVGSPNLGTSDIWGQISLC